MRILFDENLDWRLRRYLPGHDVTTVTSLKWNGLKNGKLLRKAVDAGFDVFLTVDNNLGYQQDIPAHPIAVIVLCVHRNRVDYLAALVPALQRVLPLAPKGQVTEVDG